VRLKIAPAAAGSAEAYVAREFPNAAALFRAEANHQEGLGLLVLVDADLRTVRDRCNQLNQCLLDAGRAGRNNNERICLLVPRRHIETWVRHANGEAVDETRDIKRELGAVDADLLRRAAIRFDELRRDPACPLASLTHTLAETARVGL
jgi:hypothetical protein